MENLSYSVAKPDTEEEWISSQGPDVKKLEEEWAKYVGTKYAVACSSGTDALKLALCALGIGPGDEVIVPEFTMIATAWAVTYVGATPVFVDCGDDLNIDVEKIEEKITSRTKAIMPVHIYGRPADMKAIMRIAYEYNLFVVEDVAEAHGASIDGVRVGAWGHLGCFSLYANKIITSGEGGLITTNSEWWYRQAQHYKSVAFDEGHTFLHKKVGYNDRMTNMQAKIALKQLSRIDEFLAKRSQIQGWYDKYLNQLGLYTIPRPEGSVLWMYDILYADLVNGGALKREKLISNLKEKGIETRRFFKPMSEQPMYKGEYRVLKAFKFSRLGLYLPTYTQLTKEDVKYISEQVILSCGLS